MKILQLRKLSRCLNTGNRNQNEDLDWRYMIGPGLRRSFRF
jgi:hypothetical protein